MWYHFCMSETAESQLPPQAPKGCSEVPITPAKTFIGRILHPSPRRISPEEAQREWGEQEQQAQAIFSSVVRYGILDYSLTSFDQVDEEIGVSSRILLAQGLADIQNGNLAVVTSNRIGFKLGNNRNNLLCIGGRFGFSMNSYNTPDKIRRVKGGFVGVVLNLDKKIITKPFKNDKDVRTLSPEEVEDIYLAIIEAEKALIRAKKNNTIQECLSPQELDAALNWALFGK